MFVFVKNRRLAGQADKYGLARWALSTQILKRTDTERADDPNERKAYKIVVRLDRLELLQTTILTVPHRYNTHCNIKASPINDTNLEM